MTKAGNTETVLRLLATAFERDKDAPGPHVVDDESLLARWSAGVLRRSEHQQIMRHLAGCAECRDTVGWLVKNGDFVPAPPLTPVWRRRSFHVAAASVVAIAAALLLAIMLPGVRPGAGETRLGRSLALTEYE